MLPGDAPPFLLAPTTPAAAKPQAAPQLDRPRKPRPTGGPEGPWWRRPVRPE